MRNVIHWQISRAMNHSRSSRTSERTLVLPYCLETHGLSSVTSPNIRVFCATSIPVMPTKLIIPGLYSGSSILAPFPRTQHLVV
jgi:hypothetical protein